MVQHVNVAVIGTGYWGRKLLTEYRRISQESDDVKLVAVADESPAILANIGKEFNIPRERLFEDYRDVLALRDINAVHIATPNYTHYKVAQDAIDNGKNVLLEKPMTLSTREAFKLSRNAEKNGLILLVGHIYRFNNAVNKLRELVEEGLIGKPYYMELTWTTYMTPPNNRDIIFDLAPHPVDIINHVLEEWPVKVSMQARSFQRERVGLEETAFITSNMPNGEIATITLSWIQPGPKRREIVLVGSDATLYVDTLNQEILCYNNGNGARQIAVEKNNTMETMIKGFIEAVSMNNPPRNSALVGSMTVSVLESMRKSLEREVTVPTIIG